ncbi:ATP-binding protein [Streptomyces lancefieldiae]|uniref:ATP-binding protein n=1 Tax=Streptomyces lancefieldiae TaxID=3075520 RepID=A0ABU3B116_9ACTN|nr:ATP-binding protein [Streptomyces sp. DSM 40712]MDT0616144.1 ATP-binding protein [Streptomyces sp. DSM 40712]
MTTEAIIFLVTAVILPLLLTELGDWCPTLAKRLARWTARRLGDPLATERYSEEWTAELGHLPGKLAPMFVALGYFVALPRLRWSLRTARRTSQPGQDLSELAPTRVPIYENFELAMYPWAHQGEACSTLLKAILDASNRSRLHLLLGPPGSGKTMTAAWLGKRLVQEGKKVHYIWAPDWAHRMNPLHVSPQLRDRLIQATQDLGLLVVDEVDDTTLEVLETLRLPCPVLLITREVWAPGTSRELTRRPSSPGVTVDYRSSAGIEGYLRPSPGIPGPLPPVNGQS